MEPGNSKSVEELEEVRRKLSQQIEEAQRLFATERNGHELQTSKAALKRIEELLEGLPKRQVGT